jgi:inosine-uridine nucleoside N-ribohydrolase
MKVLEQKPQTRYVCVAPQSNLALVLDALGDRAGSLPVLMMGGALEYRRKDVAEYNIRHDIAAARKVFASRAQLTYVMSDTTFKPDIEITAEHSVFQQLVASAAPHHRMMVENCRAFFAAKYPSTIMHDPLTVSTLFRNDVVRFREAELVMNDIGQISEERFGKTVRISCSADYAGFMKLFEKRL